MKKFFAILILLVGTTCFAADPTLKLSLDKDGYCHLSPVLEKGTAYDFQLFSIDANNCKVELTWIEGGRPKHKWFSLPIAVDGEVPPGPIPPPPPTPPPTPPIVASQLVVIVEQAPVSNASWETPAVKSFLAAKKITAFTYQIASVNDPNYTDDAALRWIGRSAGKPIPYAFIADSNGKTLWEGSTLSSDQAWLAKFGSYTAKGGAK